jgi:hypothetical protein
MIARSSVPRQRLAGFLFRGARARRARAGPLPTHNETRAQAGRTREAAIKLHLALDTSQGWLFGNAKSIRPAGETIRPAGYEVIEIPNSKRRCPNEVLVFAGGGGGATILSSVHLPVCSRNGTDAVLPPPSVDAIRLVDPFATAPLPVKALRPFGRGYAAALTGPLMRRGQVGVAPAAKRRERKETEVENANLLTINEYEEGWPQPHGNCGGCDV